MRASYQQVANGARHPPHALDIPCASPDVVLGSIRGTRATTTDPYAELQRIARRQSQRGHFTSAPAQAAGMSRMQLSRLVASGLIVRAAPRVYRSTVAGAADWKDRLAVELLSTGGLACGLTSSALYDLANPPANPCVLVDRGGRTATTKGRHTTRDLPNREVVTVDGLRTRSPIRAVLDSVHRVPHAQAVAMVESAIVRGLVKPVALRRRAEELAHPKRPGCALVLGILADLPPDLERSRNEWEALVARRAQACGLDLPHLEYELFIDRRRYIADAAWPESRLALEFDGRDPHMRRRVHDYDSGRRNHFADAGWLRFGGVGRRP